MWDGGSKIQTRNDETVTLLSVLTPIVMTVITPTRFHRIRSSPNKKAKAKTKTRFDDLHIVYRVSEMDLREVLERPMSSALASAQGTTFELQ